MSVNNSSIDIT